jgi:cystathionine beta-lyase/cystathionine gamma-synthase
LPVSVCLSVSVCLCFFLLPQGPEKRAEYGIKDSLVRFSCGVEDVEDLWDDLAQALEKI